jgi:hypothetical protein
MVKSYERVFGTERPSVQTLCGFLSANFPNSDIFKTGKRQAVTVSARTKMAAVLE